jgi:hypothetical protein
MLARDAREGVADESTRSTHGDARACGVRVIRFFRFISCRRAAAAKDDETREEGRGEERTGREAWESGGVGEEGRWVRARGDAS